MTGKRPNPFDSLESAQEYMTLLGEALDEAYASILDDTAAADQTRGAKRRVDALRLVQYKMNRLRQNVVASRVLLNDLRMLRRLLLGERDEPVPNPTDEP